MLVCSAAASGNVDEAVLRHATEMCGSIVRQFLIFAHLVGQSSVGIDGDGQGTVGSELFDEGSQVCDAKRTVQAEAEQIGVVADARKEGPEGLPREGASAAVVDGDRHHDGNFAMKLSIQFADGM